MVNFLSKELLAKRKAQSAMKPGVRLEDHIRPVDHENPNIVAEFIGTGDFSAEWVTRRNFEIQAGRDEEPELWRTIYGTVVQDASLPEIIEVLQLGPGGVVFEEIEEGGEVKFATVGEDTYSIRQRQFAVALEYSKRMVRFNQFWNMGIIERRIGTAYNALMNHLHLGPIVQYSYGAANQTGANTDGESILENYVLTLDDAVTNSMSDTDNPRRGRYDLFVNSGQFIKTQNALRRTLQDGNGAKSASVEMIENVIAYDGWTGTRGKKKVTYPGVPTGKAYLVSKQYSTEDFQHWMNQGLEDVMGTPDASRFIVEQRIWDLFLGIYANPLRAVEEITWPTGA